MGDRDPDTARMPGLVAVKDSPSIMGNDEEAVKHAEGERRQGEEVHGSNRFTMVIQKCCPSLRRFWIRCAFLIQRNGPFRNVEAKHL